MSNWIEIRNEDDVVYDPHADSIDIVIGSDQFGNNYITVPAGFIIDKLRGNEGIINREIGDKLAYMSGLLQGMSSYLHERLD